MQYRRSLPFLVALIRCCTVVPLYGQETDALYPMQKKTNWGFINAQGEWEIEPQYPQVLSFSEGLAGAQTVGANQWGFLNKQGEWAIAPEFGRRRSAYRTYGGKRFYSPPFDPFRGELAPALVDGDLAYIDKQGETVKRFPEYDELRPFHDGLAVFSIDDEKGYLNKEWDVAIEPAFEEAGDFHEGLAAVNEGFADPYGYVNKQGDFEIDPQYDEAGPFSEGLAPVQTGAFDPYGYINPEGEWAIEPQFEEAKPFSEGLAFVSAEDDNEKYYIDNTGTPQITSPIDGFTLCHGHPFHNGLALVSLVKEGEECGRVTRVGTFRKTTNSAYAYINTSGEIVYRQSQENGRYLKRANDSIEAAERRAEERREKAEARREQEQLAACDALKAYGDTTASSYLELGYKGVNRRFYYDNDVFQQEGSQRFTYHIPAFQDDSGTTFLRLQAITLAPSFTSDDVEAHDLGYQFSLRGPVLRNNECMKFPSDASENGSIMNVTRKGQSNVWEHGQIKYTDPDNSKNYILIRARPDQYMTPQDAENEGASTGGFMAREDERVTLSGDDRVEFEHYPNRKELRISAQASRETGGNGVRVHTERVRIDDFERSTGRYFDDPVHRFDEHYVEYYDVVEYSPTKAHVKHYRKPLSEEETVENEDLSFSKEYLVGEYIGGDVVTAADPSPVVFELSN